MSSIVKRSVVVAGRKTSISLEEVFWNHVKRLAHEKHTSLAGLLTSICDRKPRQQNLSSAIRCFVVTELEERLAAIAAAKVAEAA
jgi:predicted DNA-binding ribbon-helix-helix protein